MNEQTPKYSHTGKYRPLPKGATAKPSDRRHARRSFLNNYRAKGYYLITATINPDIVFIPLSSMLDVSEDELKISNMIMPSLSKLGEMIRQEITGIPNHHPEIHITRYVIMPDHIHIVLNVKERLKRHLGNELAGFFGACSKHYNIISNSKQNHRLFLPFHARIIYNFEQLDRAVRYVEDNPRRYILKKRNPMLFRKYLNLRINDKV